MQTPQRSRLKKRDLTLNPLSEEWIRRKATPFGVRLLEGRSAPERPDYTKKVMMENAVSKSVRVHPFALLSTKLPIRKLIESKRTERRAIPQVHTRSVRDVMKAQLLSNKNKDINLAKGRI